MTVWYKDKKIGGTRQKLHRYLWEQVHGPIPEGMTIDHIDGDRKNNDMTNLRMVSQSDNLKNMRTRSNQVPGVRIPAGRVNGNGDPTIAGRCTGIGRQRITNEEGGAARTCSAQICDADEFPVWWGQFPGHW